MNGKRLLPLLASIAVLASACTQKNTGDEPAASTVPQGLDRFLLFPNPVSMSTGGFETNTSDYADAYYRAIDPNNDKDTIDKWKAQNGFSDSTSPLAGTEQMAVFRDTKDLGYGRRMTGRRNTSADPKIDGSVAFYVENYSVAPNASGGYSSILNVEAAIRRDTRWHVGTNAIEWSTAPCSMAELAEGCNPNAKFAKFYSFSSKDGTRQFAVDLDGNGPKAMPGPCITCHGGRGDPLTPPDATGKPRFPLVENGVSRKRGDVQARLHGMNVGSFGFSPDFPSFSRTAQEGTLKTFNQWILCSYPLAGAAAGAEDACRVAAGANEWQGTAAEMVKSWYGGPGMPNGTFLDAYVPAGWASNQSLYTGAVAPYCRTCHILRGTKNQDDIDFMTAAKFLGQADRIKAHVFDRGTMPLALIVYNDFWSSSAPTLLANAINPSLGALTPPQTATDSGGAALTPGRPIPDAGPNRMVKTSTNVILTGENSLFPTSFTWSQDPANPAGATITNPNSMIATFNAAVPGNYTVRLSVGNDPAIDAKAIITVDDSFPDPVKFAHVKNVLQNITHATGQKCTGCHVSPAVSPTPPIFYNNIDRDGVGGVTATDEAWFLKALSGRVNLTDMQESPLLRKPSGDHHNGGKLFDLATSAGLENYSIFYSWILAGMPPGGVAASALVNGGNLGTSPSPLLFTFSGSPLSTPAIPLDGSPSVGATTYSWSVFGPPGPLGTPPSITNPNSASATLNVFNVGTYVVQLQVTDGAGSSDTVQKTIFVGETAITASFTPATGSSQLTFSGNPARGPITLTSTSIGNPTTCRWQVFGPAGATLVTPPTIVTDLPQSCGIAATLSVPATTIGSSYTVQLTASNLASSVADNFIVIAAAPGQNASNANFNPPASTISFTVNGNTANATQTRINNVATNLIPLSGTANGLAPLTFTWSLPSGAGTAGCSTPAAGQSTSLPVTKSGTCDVMLTVSNGLPGVSTVTKTVTVTSAVTFSQVVAILGNGGTASPGTNGFCTGCHGTPGSSNRPSWENVLDGGVSLYDRLTSTTGVINFGTPRSSLLLNCPTNGCDVGPVGGAMGGGQTGFVNGTVGGMINYDAFLTWITNGAPL